MDVRNSLASQAYQTARSAASPQPRAPGGGAEAALGQFATSFAATLQTGEATARSAMTGGADPHALVQALASSQMAVETVVTVRDRVVEAYQEILRMPV
jgi:flagellar hook-basal body complex protein FliE